LVSTKLDTFCYLTVQTALCYATCRRFDTILACGRRTDGRTDGQTGEQTDGIAVASTALAMRALRCTVKIANFKSVVMMTLHKVAVWAQYSTNALANSTIICDPCRQ